MSSVHVSPLSTYFTIFGALMVLSAITVGAAFVNLGSLNPVVALAIAALKATLVILFFMHLKYDKIFHTVVFLSAVLAAALFVGFTLMDSGQYQNTNIWNPDAPPLAPIGPRPVLPQ